MSLHWFGSLSIEVGAHPIVESPWASHTLFRVHRYRHLWLFSFGWLSFVKWLAGLVGLFTVPSRVGTLITRAVDDDTGCASEEYDEEGNDQASSLRTCELGNG